MGHKESNQTNKTNKQRCPHDTDQGSPLPQQPSQIQQLPSNNAYVAQRNLCSYLTNLFRHVYTGLAVKGKMKLKTEFYFQTYNLFSFLLHHNVHLAVLIFKKNYLQAANSLSPKSTFFKLNILAPNLYSSLSKTQSFLLNL